MSRYPAEPGRGSAREPISPSSKREVPEAHSYIEPATEKGSGIEALLANTQGYIVGRFSDHLLRAQTDAHILTIAPTGAGKGIGAVIPNLLDHPGSAFVVDIRGETVAKTANLRRLIGQHVVVLDPYNVTKGKWGQDSYNPLDNLDPNEITFEADVEKITRALLYDPDGRKSNEPIWDLSTEAALNGAITYVITCLPQDRRNLQEVKKIFVMSGDETGEFVSKLMAACKAAGDNVYSSLKQLLYYYTDARDKTKITDNAIAQANSVLRWIGRREFRDILSASTFSFKNIREIPTTIYLVLPEEYIQSCAVWVRVMVEDALFSLEDLYMTQGLSSSQLGQRSRTLFLLDEFPAFGKLEAVERGMATVRGRGANLWLFVQNIGQLERIYGKESARAIIGNASIIQAFESNEIEELEYLCRLIGEEMFDVQSVTMGTSSTKGGSRSTGQTYTLTNSESVAHGTSTSKTETEGTSEGVTSSQSRGFSGPRGFFGYRRENQSEGISTGISSSRNRSVAISQGSSTTQTTGTSRSEGTTTTEGQTWSDGQSKSLTIKPEQRRIETTRSLRMKISERNQLLVVRRHLPFLSPRMSYIQKYDDTKEYMFPDMVALASEDGLERLIRGPFLSKPLVLPHLASKGDIYRCLHWSADHRVLGADVSKIHEWHHDLQKTRDRLSEQRVVLQEFYSVMQVLWRLVGLKRRIEVVEQMKTAVDLHFIFREPKLDALFSLPLMNTRGVTHLKGERETDAFPEVVGVRNGPWLAEVYKRPLEEVLSLLQGMTDMIRGVNDMQESARKSIVKSYGELKESMNEALMKASWRDIERRRKATL